MSQYLINYLDIYGEKYQIALKLTNFSATIDLLLCLDFCVNHSGSNHRDSYRKLRNNTTIDVNCYPTNRILRYLWFCFFINKY